MVEYISEFFRYVFDLPSILLPIETDFFYFVLPFIIAFSCFVIYEVLRIIVRAVYR